MQYTVTIMYTVWVSTHQLLVLSLAWVDMIMGMSIVLGVTAVALG